MEGTWVLGRLRPWCFSPRQQQSVLHRIKEIGSRSLIPQLTKGQGPWLVSEAGIWTLLGQGPQWEAETSPGTLWGWDPGRVSDFTGNYPSATFSSEQSTGPKSGWREQESLVHNPAKLLETLLQLRAKGPESRGKERQRASRKECRAWRSAGSECGDSHRREEGPEVSEQYKRGWAWIPGPAALQQSPRAPDEKIRRTNTSGSSPPTSFPTWLSFVCSLCLYLSLCLYTTMNKTHN